MKLWTKSLYKWLNKVPAWQPCLVYRTAHNSTGLLFTIGPTVFSVAAGWRVPELREFPIKFSFGFFRRADFADTVDAFHCLFSLRVGRRRAIELR